MLCNICDSVLTCCFAPCGWLLASGDSGGEIIIWDIHAGNHLYCKTAHDMGVNCILFSTKWDPNQGQHTMISAGSDCMIYLWNITTNASKWWCLSCLFRSCSMGMVPSIFGVPEKIREYVTFFYFDLHSFAFFIFLACFLPLIASNISSVACFYIMMFFSRSLWQLQSDDG